MSVRLSKKNLVFHIKKRIILAIKYLVPFVVFVCFVLWNLLCWAKDDYIIESADLYDVTGICSDVYFDTRRNLMVGKRTRDVSRLVLVIDDKEHKMAEGTYQDIPQYEKFIDTCAGKELFIQYTIVSSGYFKGDYKITSMSTSDGETVYLDLEEQRSEGMRTLIIFAGISVFATIFLGWAFIGSFISESKLLPSIKQIRKWHQKNKASKKRVQAKKH